MNNWQDAAYRYRLADRDMVEESKMRKVQQLIEQVEKFLEDQEGRDALDLIDACQVHVKLFEDGPKERRLAWYLTQRGFEYFDVNTEAAMPCLPKDAVRAFVAAGNSSDVFMSWLRYKLDELAAAAPNPFPK